MLLRPALAEKLFYPLCGKEFAQIPCLNEHLLCIEALGKMIRRFLA
jgi:hypothetical protein